MTYESTDVGDPIVTLTHPVGANTNASDNMTFVSNATDDLSNFQNATLYHDINGTWGGNQTNGSIVAGTSANLTRGSGATIFSSSNSDNVVTFSAGTKDVFCTMPASKSVYLDATGTPVGAASAGFALAMAVAL